MLLMELTPPPPCWLRWAKPLSATQKRERLGEKKRGGRYSFVSFVKNGWYSLLSVSEGLN